MVICLKYVANDLHMVQLMPCCPGKKAIKRMNVCMYVLVRVPRPDFGPYPALRVKVFFFADSGSPEGRLQFPGG